MRRDSIRFYGYAALTGLMMIAPVSSSANEVTAEVPSPEVDAAILVTLSGVEAKQYYDNYQPTMRVFIATAAEKLIAVAFDEDVPEIFAPDAPPKCIDEGGAICCDPETQTLFLSAMYQNQPGWVRTGELCEAPGAARGVRFVTVLEEVTQALAANFGVDGCFMLLAEADGTPRVLVNAPSQDSWRWSYCLNELAGLKGSSKSLAGNPPEGSEFWVGLTGVRISLPPASAPVTLVNHYGSPPPPNVILAAPPFCNTSGTSYRRCHDDTFHLFYKDSTVSYPRWVAVRRCDCP